MVRYVCVCVCVSLMLMEVTILALVNVYIVIHINGDFSLNHMNFFFHSILLSLFLLIKVSDKRKKSEPFQFSISKLLTIDYDSYIRGIMFLAYFFALFLRRIWGNIEGSLFRNLEFIEFLQVFHR